MIDYACMVQHLSGPDAAFPLRAGSHLRMTNPALEFVKAVCHVLALDAAAEPQVQLLKKHLLRLVQVCAILSVCQVSLL